MYEDFYGLKEKPFNILPDPDYLYMSKGHENAYTHLEYAIMENKGFVVVTGEIGSGKTTFSECISKYSLCGGLLPLVFWLYSSSLKE